MLNVIIVNILNIIKIKVVLLSIIILCVVMLNVVMLSVLDPVTVSPMKCQKVSQLCKLTRDHTHNIFLVAYDHARVFVTDKPFWPTVV